MDKLALYPITPRTEPPLEVPARRALLARGLGLLGSSLLPGQLLSGEASTALTLSGVAPQLFLVNGTGVNTVLFAPAGTAPLVVDAGAASTAAAFARLIAGAAPDFPKPILINTHWHEEQTGANDHFGAQGSRIIAHENTRLWMTVPIACKWQGRTFLPRAIAARPNDTFYDKAGLEAGNEQVECGYLLQAHTDGDVYVRFRNANVIAAGDVVSGSGYPIIDYCTSGSLAAMVSAQRALLDMSDDRTTIIPGRGSVLSRAQLAAQMEMMTTIRDRLYDLVKRGMSAEEMVAARPTREFDAQYGDPGLMIRNAARALAENARQVPGVV